MQIRASAAGSSWVDRLAAYQVSKWEDLPSDFQALAEDYVNTFNSMGTKGYFDSAIDIPLNWYYILDDATPVLSIGGAVFYYLDGNGNLKYTKKGSSGSGNSITDNATIVSSRDDLVVDGKHFISTPFEKDLQDISVVCHAKREKLTLKTQKTSRRKA